MVSVEVVNWVKENLSKGHDASYLKNQLLQQGHQQADVDEAFNQVEAQTPSQVLVKKDEKKKSKKWVWITLGILLLLLALLFIWLFWPRGETSAPGVVPGTPSTPATPPVEIDTSTPKNYAFDTILTGDILFVEGDVRQNIRINAKGEGIIDVENKKSYSKLDISVITAGESDIDVSTESYAIGDTTYIKVQLVGMDQWIKVTPSSSDALLGELNIDKENLGTGQNLLEDQFEMIGNSEIIQLDDEGKHLRIVPDKAIVEKLAQKMYDSFISKGESNLIDELKMYNVDYFKSVEELNIEIWLDDENRLTTSETRIKISFDEKSITPKNPSGKLDFRTTATIRVTTNVRGYGIQREIVLPSGAKSAISIDNIASLAAFT